MRKPATLYGPILSLPLFIWQLLFFLAPLLFLTALSFWTVRNLRMEPDFSPENWEWMLCSGAFRSAEHTSELQSLMRISYAVLCLQKKTYSENVSKSVYSL